MTAPMFGISAFLKLVSLNPRPQRTEIRRRLSKRKAGGYDFHKSLRELAHDHLVDGMSLEDVLAKAGEIVREPERKSAVAGLETLGDWRRVHLGTILHFAPVTFESPGKFFRVQFTPNFGLEIGAAKVATHIWNTKSVDLDQRMTYAALSLFPELYASHDARPDDLGVLSLPDSALYRLSEAGDYSEVGRRLVRRLDDLFNEVSHEDERPSAPKRKPRPTPPPPSGSR